MLSSTSTQYQYYLLNQANIEKEMSIHKLNLRFHHSLGVMGPVYDCVFISVCLFTKKINSHNQSLTQALA